MMARAKMLQDDLARVIREFPEFEVIRENAVPVMLEGPLEVFDSSGCYRGVYEVQIQIPLKEYPHAFPSLKEISRKIPREIDRHVYENTGRCCVTILQKQVIESKRGISIYGYIHKYAIPYFANQIYFEENNMWANGDYMHGDAGILQYYTELFETTDLEIVINGINVVLNHQKIGRNDTCFCGGGKFKKCHYTSIEELTWLGIDQLIEDLALMLKTENHRINESIHSRDTAVAPSP